MRNKTLHMTAALLLALFVVVSLGEGVQASEVTGTLSSSGIVTTGSTGSGSISGTVVGGNTISGTVTGGASGGTSGGGGFTSSGTSGGGGISSPQGQVLGASIAAADPTGPGFPNTGLGGDKYLYALLLAIMFGLVISPIRSFTRK